LRREGEPEESLGLISVDPPDKGPWRKGQSRGAPKPAGWRDWPKSARWFAAWKARESNPHDPWWVGTMWFGGLAKVGSRGATSIVSW